MNISESPVASPRVTRTRASSRVDVPSPLMVSSTAPHALSSPLDSGMSPSVLRLRAHSDFVSPVGTPVMSPVSSPAVLSPSNPHAPRLDLESGIEGSPKKMYCKFMPEMNQPKPDNFDEQFQLLTSKTRTKVQAFKHYMRRYSVDLANYLYSRDQRRDILEDEMSQQRLSYNEKKALREDLAKRESAYLRMKRSSIKVKDFQLLSLIGRGGYGEVYLCRKVDTKEILVLKRMKKSLYVAKNEAPRVQRERDVMSGSQSPWIIKLRFSFQDNQYLYLVMEYAPGGDIKTLLENLGQLDEKMAKFYFAEMVLCVEYLHALGFVHRDLKPGNFVIDKTGHLKLIDFGLSTEGINSRYKDQFQNWNTLRTSMNLSTLGSTLNEANRKTMRANMMTKKQRWGLATSLVGSPEYMAPEVLMKEGYDEKVDIWALGCCLFEMLVGVTPFAADTPDAVFFNVMNWPDCVIKPDDEDTEIDPDAWDLITKLLTEKEPRYTISDIKKHPYFKDIDWKNIRNNSTPFMPHLDDELDTSYFNTESLQEIDEESFDANFNSLMESDPSVQMYFMGFTYKRFDSQE